MIDFFYGALALVLSAAGVFGVYEYRSYTPEQRSSAPLLAKLYLATMVVVGGVGVAGLAWLVTGGGAMALSGAIIVVAPLPCLVQYLFHRTLDIERSPLAGRISGKIARKFNVPEH